MAFGLIPLMTFNGSALHKECLMTGAFAIPRPTGANAICCHSASVTSECHFATLNFAFCILHFEL